MHYSLAVEFAFSLQPRNFTCSRDEDWVGVVHKGFKHGARLVPASSSCSRRLDLGRVGGPLGEVLDAHSVEGFDIAVRSSTTFWDRGMLAAAVGQHLVAGSGRPLLHCAEHWLPTWCQARLQRPSAGL